MIELVRHANDRHRQKFAEIHIALKRSQTGKREAVAMMCAPIYRIVTPKSEPVGLEVEGTVAELTSDSAGLEHSGIGRCTPPRPWFASGNG